MKVLKRILACFLLIMTLCTIVLPVSADIMDPDQLCSLEISFRYENEPVSGAEFQVWRVGELSEHSALSLSGVYAEYPVRVSSNMTNEEFQTAANTLVAYVQKDNIEPDFQGETDANGILRFEALTRGLYLVTSTPHPLSDKALLHTLPQLVILPYRRYNVDQWEYDVVMNTKSALKQIPEEPMTVRVLKKWDDDGAEHLRPASITVYLLCDGKIYDTVKLHAENSWRYAWDQLDPDCQWSVVEEIDGVYTVTVEKKGVTYVITNSYDDPPPPPPPSTEEPPPEIPDTGLNWWPTIIMGALGVGLIAAGLLRRKEDRNEA